MFFWHIQKIKTFAGIKLIKKKKKVKDTYEICMEKMIHNSSKSSLIFCRLLTFVALLKML